MEVAARSSLRTGASPYRLCLGSFRALRPGSPKGLISWTPHSFLPCPPRMGLGRAPCTGGGLSTALAREFLFPFSFRDARHDLIHAKKTASRARSPVTIPHIPVLPRSTWTLPRNGQRPDNRCSSDFSVD